MWTGQITVVDHLPFQHPPVSLSFPDDSVRKYLAYVGQKQLRIELLYRCQDMSYLQSWVMCYICWCEYVRRLDEEDVTPSCVSPLLDRGDESAAGWDQREWMFPTHCTELTLFLLSYIWSATFLSVCVWQTHTHNIYMHTHEDRKTDALTEIHVKHSTAEKTLIFSFTDISSSCY